MTAAEIISPDEVDLHALVVVDQGEPDPHRGNRSGAQGVREIPDRPKHLRTTELNHGQGAVWRSGDSLPNRPACCPRRHRWTRTAIFPKSPCPQKMSCLALPVVSVETRELLESYVGREVAVHWPGEPIAGPDGEMVGMTEPRDVTATLARPRLTPIEGDIGDVDD